MMRGFLRRHRLHSLLDLSDPRDRDRLAHIHCEVLVRIAHHAIAIAAGRDGRGREPTTVEILDEVTFLAEQTKDLIRSGYFQESRRRASEAVARAVVR